MATLILLRHAKAESSGPTDFERPLAARGHEQTRAVAQNLLTHGLAPEVVLCSAALRTRQTWADVAAGLGEEQAATVHYLEELYSARPKVVRSLVREYSGQAQTVLVVGHEPIMSMTATDFAGADSDRTAMFSVQSGMSTASMAVLDLTDFASRRGTLRPILRAD